MTAIWNDEDLMTDQRDGTESKRLVRMSDVAIEKQLTDDPNGAVTVEMYEMHINDELLNPLEDARNDVEILEILIKNGVGRNHHHEFDELYAKAEEKVTRVESSLLHQRLSLIRDERALWKPAA
jgi:hypothetical protein